MDWSCCHLRASPLPFIISRHFPDDLCRLPTTVAQMAVEGQACSVRGFRHRDLRGRWMLCLPWVGGVSFSSALPVAAAPTLIANLSPANAIGRPRMAWAALRWLWRQFNPFRRDHTTLETGIGTGLQGVGGHSGGGGSGQRKTLRVPLGLDILLANRVHVSAPTRWISAILW